MKRRTIGKSLFIIAAFFFALFLMLTYLLLTRDVANVGFEGTPLGLSSINTRFFRAFGYNEDCYVVTEYLGYICIAMAFANALLALNDFTPGQGLVPCLHQSERWLYIANECG